MDILRKIFHFKHANQAPMCVFFSLGNLTEWPSTEAILTGERWEQGEPLRIPPQKARNIPL